MAFLHTHSWILSPNETKDLSPVTKLFVTFYWHSASSLNFQLLALYIVLVSTTVFDTLLMVVDKINKWKNG